MTSGNAIDQEQLVAQLRAKDKEAFAYLYDHYAGAVFGIISRIIFDEDVAKEVLQDAFMKFWDKIDHFDSEKGRLFTWMANITRNLSIDKLRSKELKKAGKTGTLDSYVTGIDQSNQYHQTIDTIGLKEALNSLREEERFILEMAYFKGYTQSEISDEYDIPLGTVKTRLRMGLKSLREVLNVK
ncbi:MAG: sigma-70 family RNA polymerase sigma factor [Ekhidna sp.]